MCFIYKDLYKIKTNNRVFCLILFQTRGSSPLHKLKWLRVVLDEGHTIRNPNAQQTKAVLDLNAQRRWILTGNLCYRQSIVALYLNF